MNPGLISVTMEEDAEYTFRSRAHTSSVRPLREETHTHTHTFVTNGGWNLLRDSDSRCLGSDSSDSSPGDICSMQGRNRKLVRKRRTASFAFVREGKRSARLLVSSFDFAIKRPCRYFAHPSNFIRFATAY